MKTILITGASGFIGRQLCSQLSGSDYRLIGLSRTPERQQKLWPSIEWIGKLNEISKTTRIDIVVNLAGASLSQQRWSEKVKETIFSSRIETTKALYDFFKSHLIKPSVLINASAIGYYGPQADEPLTEQSSAVDSFSHRLCAEWETEACAFSQLGTRVCLLRLGIVLDRNGGALQAMLPAFSMGAGGPMGSGKQWMSWIHRNDVIRLILFCLEQPISGPINAVAPNPQTNEVFSKTLARTLRRPCFMRTPAWVLTLVFGEMAKELLLSGQRVMPTRALEQGFRFDYPDLDKALAAIFDKT